MAKRTKNTTTTTNEAGAVAVATPTVVATTTPAVATVPATAKAAAAYAAGVAKRGGHVLTPNQRATLLALASAGAKDVGAAITHAQLAALTGRAKGNQCRTLEAGALLVQLNWGARHGFYITAAGLNAIGK